MYYTIYKMTNKVNGRFYIGSHKTEDLNDNYSGSGTYLRNAINKYGLDDFNKEILFIFNTSSEMYDKEAEIVNKKFLAEENTYNLKVGGFGGFDFINTQGNPRRGGFTELDRKKAQEVIKLLSKNKQWMSNKVDKFKDTYRKKCESGFVNNTFGGKKHTDETKSLMRETHRNNNHAQGSKNSQYGTMWITNGTINKKIKKDCDIPSGYRKGRRLKK